MASTRSTPAAGRAEAAAPAEERGRARELVGAFRDAGKEFLADDCMGLAQQIAYSSLLAFFPAVVALAGLLGLIDAYDVLRDFLAPVAPQAVLSLLDTAAEDAGGGRSVVALVAGSVGALWAASGAMNAIVKAVNRAWDCEETRPAWRRRILAGVLVVAWALVAAALVVLVILGGTIGDAIAQRAGLGDAFAWTWNLARWPIAFAAVVALFSLVYYLAPNTDPPWRYVTPGSVLGGLLWLALSGLFALYTSFSDSYTRTYGVLATGIVLLLWLNYSAWALLYGAELNAVLERRKALRR